MDQKQMTVLFVLGCVLVVVRASDLWSSGHEFDFRPCTAGL